MNKETEKRGSMAKRRFFSHTFGKKDVAYAKQRKWAMQTLYKMWKIFHCIFAPFFLSLQLFFPFLPDNNNNNNNNNKDNDNNNNNNNNNNKTVKNWAQRMKFCRQKKSPPTYVSGYVRCKTNLTDLNQFSYPAIMFNTSWFSFEIKEILASIYLYELLIVIKNT